MARAYPRFERVVEADRRWFRRHPHRSYRLRPMAEAELQTFASEGAPFAPAVPGHRWWVGIKQVRSGYRVKIFFQSDLPTDVEHAELQAGDAYEAMVASSTEAKRTEAVMVSVVRGMRDAT